MIKLSGSDILGLLPPHIADDPSFAAAGEALAPHLQRIARSISNLLIFARVGGQTPERMLPPLYRLTKARGGLKSPETELLETLAWQLHVDFREVAKTDAQLAGMVLNSIPWHRIKGTPAGIKNALSLFEYHGLRIEEDGTGDMWATWQLGLDDVPEMDDIRRIVAICREMQPARCRLWRMSNTEYDWRPGIWSGGAPDHAWSNCWWSLYSGTAVPGIPGVDDEHELIVSFGKKDGYQAEQYASGLVGLAFQQVLASLIPYIDRPIWSRSFWSELYPMNSTFIIGELVGLQAERSVKKWQMFWREWAKAQAVWSWPSPPLRKPVYGAKLPYGRDGVYGEINANYSLPFYTVMGPAPRWGDALWSDDKVRLQIIRILEQFHRISSHVSQAFAPVGPQHGAAFTALRTMLAPYSDRARWSHALWGEVFPRNHTFFRHDVFATLSGHRITTSWPWSGPWDERPWRRTIRWDRYLPAWAMFAQQWYRSQAVYSWPGDVQADGSRDGVYGEINANYSRPKAVLLSAPPRWSDKEWSEEEPQRQELVIEEQLYSKHGHSAQPLAPSPHQALAIAVERAILGIYPDQVRWGRSLWGDSPVRQHSFSRLDLFATSSAARIVETWPWSGLWDERPWRKTLGWDKYLPDWAMFVQSWCKSQAVHSWPGDVQADGSRDGVYGEINANYSRPKAVLLSTPPRWSDKEWSEEEAQRQELVIEEQFHDKDGLIVQPLAPSPRQVVALAVERTIFSNYPDQVRWGRSLWGDCPVRQHSFSRLELLATSSAERVVEKWPWSGPWDERPWRKTLGWDKYLPDWTMFVQSWCKSQAVYAWPGEVQTDGSRDGVYGEINANYSRPTAVLLSLPPRWSDKEWSEEDPQRQELVIEEQVRHTLGTSVPNLSPERPLAVSMCLHGAQSEPLSPLMAQTVITSVTAWDDLHVILHTQAPGVTVVPEDIFGSAA